MKIPHLLLAAALIPAAATAATGTWTDTGTGPSNWSDTTKWSGGTVADGSTFTANFTSNITGTTTVTLDSARTIQTVVFSDNGAAGSSWLLTGSNTLTLAGTTPGFTMTTSAEVATVIAGTAGLRRTGGQTLTLSGLNSYTRVTPSPVAPPW